MALYAFNGTWNSLKNEDEATDIREYDDNTNVVKFRDAYTAPNAFYRDGVGTRIGWLGRFFGGAFGIGGQERLQEAQKHLLNQLRVGDEIVDIVGFSRGAALAIAFANRIWKKVKDPRTGQVPQIRFVGVWDLVGAFGIPINVGPLRFQEYNIGYTFELPPNVQHCYHAMALDERRQTFKVTRLNGAYEVWFRGAHSDVGGGNGNLGLNNIALCWMLRKATATGLPIDETHVLAAQAKCKADCAVKWPRDLVKNRKRAIVETDRIHYTVSKSGNPDYNDPPLEKCQLEDLIAELAPVTTSRLA